MPKLKCHTKIKLAFPFSFFLYVSFSLFSFVFLLCYFEDMTNQRAASNRQTGLMPFRCMKRKPSEQHLTIETTVFDPPPTFARHLQTDLPSPSSSSSSETKSSPQRQRKRQRRYEISPTEIFAQNLSDAVLDAAAINGIFLFRRIREREY